MAAQIWNEEIMLLTPNRLNAYTLPMYKQFTLDGVSALTGSLGDKTVIRSERNVIISNVLFQNKWRKVSR